MTVKRNILTVLSVIASACLTGCFDTTQEFTINPDGSGKVIHESVFVPVQLFDANQDPDAAVRAEIRRFIDESKGVDAWRDVTFKQRDDGKVFFRGTAYFKRLADLDFPNQTLLHFMWNRQADGDIVLEAGGSRDGLKSPWASGDETDSAQSLTPEEQVKKIRQERRKYQQFRPLFATTFGETKHQVILHLPGTLKTNSNFEPVAPGTLKIALTGEKFIAAMDAVLTNDVWTEKLAAAAADPAKLAGLEDEASALIHGKPGPVRAVITRGGAALFDYNAEVAVARTQLSKLQQDLGIAVPASPPGSAGPLKSINVGAVTVTHQPNLNRHGDNRRGYELTLVAGLPQRAQRVTSDSLVEKALADDGSDLLPGPEKRRHIESASLKDDGVTAVFTVELTHPGPRAKGLKELSGRLQYTVADEIDLGFKEIKQGARGTQLDALIQLIEPGSFWQGSQELLLRLNVRPENLQDAVLVVNGARTRLERHGYAAGGAGGFSFTFEARHPIPPDARIVVELVDRTRTYTVPFKLGNITLLGESIAASAP